MKNKKTITPLMEKITIDIDLSGMKHGIVSFPHKSLIVKPLTAAFNIKWNYHRKNRTLIFLFNEYHLKKDERINKIPIPLIRKNKWSQ